jgi:hypothetical protein
MTKPVKLRSGDLPNRIESRSREIVLEPVDRLAEVGGPLYGAGRRGESEREQE